MIINELFGNPPKIKKLSQGDEFYDVVSGTIAVYRYDVEEKTIIIYFKSDGSETVFCNFGEIETTNGRIRLRHNIRNSGKPFKVFGAVISAMKQFIAEYKPEKVVIEGYEPKQSSLYMKLASKLGPPDGYNISIKDGMVFVSKKEPLSEGLIKVPTSWLEAGKRLLVSQIITWADYQLAGKFPELQKAIDELFEEHKSYYRDNLKYNPDEKIQATTIKTNDLSGSYTTLNPTSETITFAVSWEPRNTQGVYLPKRNATVLFPMSLDYLEKFPTHRSHPDDIKIALNSLLATLEHELRHAVQFILLPHDDQKYQKPGYEKHKEEYFTSPIEFDPTIGSAIGEYLDLKEYGIKLNRQSLERFLAMRPSGMSGVQPHKLFIALKNGSPVQYKRAVKKFIEELNKRI